MKKFIFTSILAISIATTALADKPSKITIAGGVAGGGYNKYAMAMSERLKQRGYSEVSVTTNNGSDAITLAACNGSADVWISQIDAIFTRYNEGCQLVPVADYGTEYAFLLVPAESDIDELSDLTENSRVATDGIGSGTELFWNTIVSIETGKYGSGDDWAKASKVESSPDTLKTMANFGDIDAAILVRKLDSNDIKLLLGQGWVIAELWDKDINDQEFNTKPLYTNEYVKVLDSSNNTHKGYAYSIKSFIGVSAKYGNDRSFKQDVASSAN